MTVSYQPLSIIFEVFDNTKFLLSQSSHESKIMKIWLSKLTGRLTNVPPKQTSDSWVSISVETPVTSIDWSLYLSNSYALTVIKTTNVMLAQLKDDNEPQNRLLELIPVEANKRFGFSGMGKSVYEKVCYLIEEQLASVSATASATIRSMYDLLFNTTLKEASLINSNNHEHTASIIKNLFEVVTYCDTHGEDALKPTGSGKEKFKGVNASYYLLGKDKQPRWVFKPLIGVYCLEGVKPIQMAKREHLAHLLNKKRIYPIPCTVFISLHGKEGSAQRFIPDAKDYDHFLTSLKPSKLSSTGLQRMFVFDLRFYSRDRHECNLLYQERNTGEQPVFGIDNGWMMHLTPNDRLVVPYTDQLIGTPFHQSVIKDILDLDPEDDALLMEKHGIHDKAIVWMKNATKCLKALAEFTNKNSGKRRSFVSAADLTVIVDEYPDQIWEYSGDTFKKIFNEILFEKEKVIDLQEKKKYPAYKGLKKSISESLLPGVKKGRGKWYELLEKRILRPYAKFLVESRIYVEKKTQSL